MSSIMDQLFKNIKLGFSYSFNFKTKSLKCNYQYLVKDGKYEGEFWNESYDNLIEKLRDLYRSFKYSVPSVTQNKSYFKALKSDELTDAELVLGEPRNLAQAKLEGYLFGLILSGKSWDSIPEFKGKWFYQDDNDKDLIIFKDWFTGENK